MTDMIEVKTADLIGPALDWAVAKAQGWLMVRVPTDIDGNFGGEVLAPPDFSSDFKFPNRGRVGAAFFLRRWSTDWAHGGPLIEKYRVNIHHHTNFDSCQAECKDQRGSFIRPVQTAYTPLVAACRAIVAANLGDTVQVPKELLP